jgi:hypothetical protein
VGLADLAARLEAQARDGEIDTSAETIAGVTRLVGQGTKALRAYLNRQEAAE